MKWFIDGNQLCLVEDDFEDLQVSEAIFIPITNIHSKEIMEKFPESKLKFN